MRSALDATGDWAVYLGRDNEPRRNAISLAALSPAVSLLGRACAPQATPGPASAVGDATGARTAAATSPSPMQTQHTSRPRRWCGASINGIAQAAANLCCRSTGPEALPPPPTPADAVAAAPCWPRPRSRPASTMSRQRRPPDPPAASVQQFHRRRRFSGASRSGGRGGSVQRRCLRWLRRRGGGTRWCS